MSSNRYAIRACRRARTAGRWALLAHLREPTSELAPEAAMALHQIAFGGRRGTWDEAYAGLCYLRVQHLVEGSGDRFRLAADVVYSLRLDAEDEREP